MDPINYSVDVATPFQAAISGYQAGAAIRNDQMAQQQQKIALQTQQAQQKLLLDLANNPNATGSDYSRVMTAMPGVAENLAKAWAVKNTEQQQAQTSDLLQWGAAIKSGQPQIAAEAMNAKADAMEHSSGGQTPESMALRHQAQVVTEHPEFALGMIHAVLSANPNGKTAADTLAAFGGEQRAQELQPAAVATANAGATIKQVEASNAATKAGLDNQKTAEEIQTAQNQRRIAELNTQIAQANSETERGKLVLERDKLAFEMKQKNQDISNATQDHMDSLTTAIDTANRLLKHPGLTSGSGAGGNFNAWFAGSDAADFRNDVQTLKSQQFLAALQDLKSNGGSGLGALSDAEGSRIESAIAALNPEKQSPTAVQNTINIIKTSLEKAQAKIVARGKLPTAGGAPVATIPGVGVVNEGDVNRILTQNPGSTREQVIRFLQERGKNTGGATGSY